MLRNVLTSNGSDLVYERYKLGGTDVISVSSTVAARISIC
jgi:hypothetical protein